MERGDDANVVECVACGSELWRSSGRSMTLAFGCSVAGLLLFFPANFLPFLSTSVLQAKRTSVIASCVSAMTNDGWPTLAAVIGFVVIVAPFARFTLLSAVLGSVLYNRRRPWLGRAFRYATWFEVWAMTDVLLVALWVAYERLDATVSTTLGAGGVCFVVVGFISLILTAALDKATVWRAIMPDSEHVEPPAVACMVCSRVEQTRLLGSDCPRCSARLRLRRPQSVSRATALVIASVILYIPANILPMATLPIKFSQVS
ncbi:MAG TPA: paraquat-inducible protein A, partial [Myxococcota bacterium]|nr:paraquat-inducible protein A [Myxococcota bacterium]